MPLDIVLYIAIIAIGVVAHRLGKVSGHEEGYEEGFRAGRKQGRAEWHRAMEQKRTGTDGQDALLRVMHPTHEG